VRKFGRFHTNAFVNHYYKMVMQYCVRDMKTVVVTEIKKYITGKKHVRYWFMRAWWQHAVSSRELCCEVYWFLISP